MKAWFGGVSGIVMAMCAAGCARPGAPVEIVALPPSGAPVSAGRELDGYPAALAAIMDALEQALGLPRADVQLVLFPDRRSFEQGLLTTGYSPELARSASSFAAIGGARAVFVNAGVVNRFDRAGRVKLVAHELVHSLQYQFSGGTRGASEQWVREGFAEWVSFRVTEHLGLDSLDSLREDLLGTLGGARFGLPPAPLDKLVTFPQWVDAQRQYEASLYAQAFLAVELLIEMRGVPAVISYFERFRQTNEHEPAFTHAFGLDRAAFERAFVSRWHETVAQFRTRR
jgi:hypothetical protein